jgi:mono/diheme cytochrome c family protein
LLAAEPQTANNSDPNTDPAAVEFFEKRVRPLLAARCQGCHGAEKQKGNLRLDSRAAALAGGDTSPAVVPGKPDESLLVDAIRYGDTYQMPPKSQLPAEEIETLVEWVRRGAPWGAEAASGPANSAASFDLAGRAKHWCFQPLASGGPPEVRDRFWVRTRVDRFILAKLEAAEMMPAPECDKRTLLRRVTYDLTGLPPAP